MKPCAGEFLGRVGARLTDAIAATGSPSQVQRHWVHPTGAAVHRQRGKPAQQAASGDLRRGHRDPRKTAAINYLFDAEVREVREQHLQKTGFSHPAGVTDS